MNIIQLEYMQQSQSLIDSCESQGTVSIAIDQFAYLTKYFSPEFKKFTVVIKKLSPDQQRPSTCIVKLSEHNVGEIKNIQL